MFRPLILLLLLLLAHADALASPQGKSESSPVAVNKCCEGDEVMVDKRCATSNGSAQLTPWKPLFTNEQGKTNLQVAYRLVVGDPDCGSTQQWTVLHYHRSTDQLHLLPDGRLRHYVHRHPPSDDLLSDSDPWEAPDENTFHHDYEPGEYCLDKNYDTADKNVPESQIALVCAPETPTDRTSAEFLVRKVLDPLFHALAIACFLAVAIVYFVMPTLRDLVGNIVSTIAVCMIVSQAADMVRIFTELTSHVSFIVADIVCYTGLLAAFFWLNSLGYYIWKTFKSRNVFLRVTDARKYCYYSSYAWTCTLAMGAVAVLAHFALEIPKSKKSTSLLHNQEVIGSLGMAVFFTPVAFTVLVNIFFYATTLQIINRMSTYGRIHEKLRHSFRLFLLVFIIMTITWLFMLLSWLNFDALVYCYVAVNALQAPLFLYVCVFDQKHVRGMLSKTCCASGPGPCGCRAPVPEPELDWGDEMTAMNMY